MLAKLNREQYPPNQGSSLHRKLRQHGNDHGALIIRPNAPDIRENNDNSPVKRMLALMPKTVGGEIQSVRRQAFVLTTEQRSDAANAIKILAGYGLTL